MAVLFAGLSGYFFYDWKIGYPKKNYRLVQYQTFEKARDYFLSHVKMGRTEKQWEDFVREQDLVHHADKKIVSPQRKATRWPMELVDYSAYSVAYKAHPKDAQDPVLWSEFLIRKQKALSGLKATFQNPLSKENRRVLKEVVKWDEPIPEEFKKGEYDANYRLLIYNTFKKAQNLFSEYQAQDKSAEDWKFYLSEADLAFNEDKSVIPSDKQNEQWSDILSDYDQYYLLAKEEIETGVAKKEPYLWKEFTSQMKWSEKAPDSMKTKENINEQLYFGIGVATLSLLTALFAFRMKNRFIAVDDDAFYAPGKKRIPFTSITKIDKRKWETKGLATVYYKDGEQTKKTRVDGMVYGQFNKDEGEPAERLFQELLSNFKGELVELVDEEEKEADK